MNYKFRKKPVVIEAFQMTKARRLSNADWPDWLHEAWNKKETEPGALMPVETVETLPTDPGGYFTPGNRVKVFTLEGEMIVDFDDYIIQGVNGELYPCKLDIFKATYDPVP